MSAGAMTVPARSPVAEGERILGFLRHYFGQERSRIASVGLGHLVLNTKGESDLNVISTQSIPAKLAGESLDAKIAILAEEFHRESMDHASTFDRPQRYVVVLYDGKLEVTASHTFRLTPPASAAQGFGGGETEPANATGALALSMRMTEASMRVGVAHSDRLLEQAYHELDRAREHERALRTELGAMFARQIEMMRAHEDLLDRKAERDLKRAAALAEQNRAERFLGYIDTIALPLVDKFAPEAGTGVLRQWLAGLQLDQVLHIMSVLKPEQWEGLRAILPAEVTSALVAWRDAQVAQGGQANGTTSTSGAPS